jgi:hypothetical protein
MSLKLFASVPMKDKTGEEIKQSLLNAKERAEYMIGEEVELIDTFITEDIPKDVSNPEVWYLGKSIELLSKADIVFFSLEWCDYRGCVIEHMIAEKYNILYIDGSTMICSIR